MDNKCDGSKGYYDAFTLLTKPINGCIISRLQNNFILIRVVKKTKQNKLTSVLSRKWFLSSEQIQLIKWPKKKTNTPAECTSTGGTRYFLSQQTSRRPRPRPSSVQQAHTLSKWLCSARYLYIGTVSTLLAAAKLAFIFLFVSPCLISSNLLDELLFVCWLIPMMATTQFSN